MEKLFDDINVMRSKELRKLLIDTLGISRDAVYKIIDRKKLKELAQSIILPRLELERTNHMKYMGKVGITFLLSFIVLYQVRTPVLGFLNEKFYVQRQRILLFRMSWKNRRFLPILILFLSMLIDLYVNLIQLSIFLSWFSIFGISIPFSVPAASLSVSPKMVTGNRIPVGGSALSQSIMNSGLNLGPMLTMWVCGYCRRWLDERASACLLDVAQAKEQKKEAKRNARAAAEAVAAAQNTDISEPVLSSASNLFS